MFKIGLAASIVFTVLNLSPGFAQAQSRGGGVPVYGNGTYYYNGAPAVYGQGINPYANPYYQTYPNYANNPYRPNYNPYAPTYLGRYNIGGVVQPVYGPPQIINGNWYGINIGGNPYTYWQAPSGYYYPWSSGFSYQDRPILVMPPNGNNPLQTQPPITTVISDLDHYLDTAKADGKISESNYKELRDKAQYLLKKEQSMAEHNEGVLDPDEEVELRKDVESLSAEVAYRVKS
jgi:hypothetical protein